MIVTLENKFPELLFGIRREFGCGIDFIDEGDLVPKQDAIVVAEIVQVIALRIVSQPDRGDAHRCV